MRKTFLEWLQYVELDNFHRYVRKNPPQELKANLNSFKVTEKPA